MARRKVTGRKRMIVLGVLLGLSASSLAANMNMWMSASLLAGSGMAAYAFLLQAGRRRAKAAANSHAGQFCTIYPAEEQAFLFAQNDSFHQAREEQSARLQSAWQETGFRHALSDHMYSRRVLVRRPAPGRKRQHLMEWGHP